MQNYALDQPLPAGECIDGGTNSTITIRFPPGSEHSNFKWPPLPPPDSGAYAFALDAAVLVLAPGCVSAAGLEPNADNGPGSPRNLWIGRLHESPTSLSLERCGCGAAVLLCGSGGITGDNLRYARHLAAIGFSVVAPDTMASPGTYPRSRPLVPNLASSLRHDGFWCADLLYAGPCVAADQGGPSPACYSSSATNILHDPLSWAAFYERVFEMRRREADAVFRGLGARLGVPRKLFLVGVSEGAMVASRYVPPPGSRLDGLVLLQWTCAANYFVSCAAHARLALPSVPTLNLVSLHDPYFASNGSIAAEVAQQPGGYGEWPMPGSCAMAMRGGGGQGAALIVDEPYHGLYAQARHPACGAHAQALYAPAALLAVTRLML